MSTQLHLKFHPWKAVPSERPRSLWMQQALDAEVGGAGAATPLRGSVRADVCIVGGGFTGLWTAIRIKEQDPAVSVVLLEAGLCGSGASGRNGGAVVGWWWKLPVMVAHFGQEDGCRLLQASVAGLDDVGAICDAHAIDAGFGRGGWFWTATNAAQVGAWRGVVEQSRSLGFDIWDVISGEELNHRFGSGAQMAGVVDRTGGVVQPAALARGLRRVALAAGVEIFEHSPVSEIIGESPLLIRIPQGEVRAEQAVLAANAWMSHLPEFRAHIFATSADMIATEPLGSRFDELGSTGTDSWSDSGLRVRFSRNSDDRRIVLGRGGGSLARNNRISGIFDFSEVQSAPLERDFKRIFPAFADLAITHRWAGPVDRSVAGLPAIGRLRADQRVAYAIGFSGTGIAPCATGGRMLASVVLGREDEWSDMARMLEGLQKLNRLPPEPLRYLGGRVVRTAVGWKESIEDRGKRPPRLLRTVAGLIPNPIKPPA